MKRLACALTVAGLMAGVVACGNGDQAVVMERPATTTPEQQAEMEQIQKTMQQAFEQEPPPAPGMPNGR